MTCRVTTAISGTVQTVAAATASRYLVASTSHHPPTVHRGRWLFANGLVDLGLRQGRPSRIWSGPAKLEQL